MSQGKEEGRLEKVFLCSTCVWAIARFFFFSSLDKSETSVSVQPTGSGKDAIANLKCPYESNRKIWHPKIVRFFLIEALKGKNKFLSICPRGYYKIIIELIKIFPRFLTNLLSYGIHMAGFGGCDFCEDRPQNHGARWGGSLGCHRNLLIPVLRKSEVGTHTSSNEEYDHEK